MRLYVLCFAAGVWWLQVQPRLPATPAYWFALPLVLAVIVGLPLVNRPLLLLQRASVAVGCVACGIMWAAWCAQQRLNDALPAEWEGKDIQLVGTVASMPEPYERSVRFEFDVERVVTPDAKVPTHVALSWWGTPPSEYRRGTLPDLHAGERWQLTVRLRQPHGTLNPHGFDYEAWLLERDIRATGYIRAGKGNVRASELVLKPQYLVERLREKIRSRINSVLPNAPYAGVLIALAIGDERAIAQSQWQTFTRTGVNHLMSISGLHITMLAGLAFAVIYFLWRRSARLTMWLPARKAAVIAGLSAAFAYAWLAGYAVPAQRTVYMLAVVAVALWLGRLTAPSVILSVALLAVLLIDPWAVLAAGFWLSFGAVAVILFVSMGRIAQPRWYNAAVSVQWAVTIALVPMLLALFQQVSLVSPLANAFAIPVVSLGVVPLTLAGIIPGLGFLLELAHMVMSWCGSALEWMSALPVAVWQQHAPPPWTIAVAMLGVAWLLLPRGFPARWLGAITLLPMFVIEPSLPAIGDLKLIVLDVGQGLSIVVQTHDHALLYDTGPSFGPQIDSGNRIIVPYLRAAGVRELSMMVLSHDDLDHTGGASSVLQAVPVKTLLHSLPAAHALLALAPSPRRCVAGERWSWDGVEFEVLHPTAASYEQEKLHDNDRGCVIRISTASISLLLTADIERKSERELLSDAPEKLRSQVLLIPHHGSGTSSSDAFVAQVHPEFAFAAVGYRNRFRHPKEEVLDRYRAIGSRIYRTDLDGALLVSSTPAGAINVQRYRALYRRYWQAGLVNPDVPDEEDDQ